MSAAFDETEALRRTRGDRLLLAELIEIFLEDSPQHLRTAEDALARGDAPALQQAVHTLKGSMTTFVLEDRDDAVHRLERTAREGELTDARELLSELERDLTKLSREVDEWWRRYGKSS